jgi:hypothetical protein
MPDIQQELPVTAGSLSYLIDAQVRTPHISLPLVGFIMKKLFSEAKMQTFLLLALQIVFN